MAEAISNTSPLLYLYRIGAVDWLGELFQDVWTPGAVALELKEGRRKGHDVPTLSNYDWLPIVDPQHIPLTTSRPTPSTRSCSGAVRRHS